ncbi:MAG: flagellar hook-length control protein FliK [Burkholderiaceae bacterium]|nr:flagellar hook-length control protein FliK [Burkholderiaceae bacterium]
MQLSLVSTTAPAGKPEVAAGTADQPAQGFDALLAALLPSPDAAAAISTDALPLAEPAAEGIMPGPCVSDTVQALLASLPQTHARALPVAAAGELPSEMNAEAIASQPASGPAAPAAALPAAAPGLASPETGFLPAQAGAEQSPASTRRQSLADRVADRVADPAADRLQLAETSPDRVPHSEGAPAAARLPERDVSLSDLPPIAGTDHRSALATELAARQTVMPVAPALSHPAWRQAFSEQVMWAARADVQSASLILNPPELGPVKIELQLAETQAMASFSSAQPEVRKAIEEALPTLKALFADAGLNLMQADVGGGDAQSHQARDNRTAAGHPADPQKPLPATATTGAVAGRPSRGLLDTFA